MSLDSMLTEIDKLRAVRTVGGPTAAPADVAPMVIAGWWAGAMVAAPSHLARHTAALRLTKLAARPPELVNGRRPNREMSKR